MTYTFLYVIGFVIKLRRVAFSLLHRKDVLTSGSALNRQLAKMSDRRTNIVVVDYSAFATRPKPAIISKFIVSELKVKPEMLLSVQLNGGRGVGLLECADSTAAMSIVAKSQRFSIENNTIPIYLDENTTEVKVHDLPVGMDNSAIEKALTCYGKVLSIVNDRWRNCFFPGLINGVRSVRMAINQALPKRIMVSNHTATIIHKGQKATRRRCDKNKKDKSSKSKQQQKPQKSDNNNSKPTTSSTPQPEMEQDEEGFEVVLSKHDRKTLKRQHSNDTEPQAKLPGHLRAEFFCRRWKEANRKQQEAVDAVSKQQAERLKKVFKDRYWECFSQLDKEEKDLVKGHEDIEDDDFYD